MAEFQEVCKHLKRMCERYGNNCFECPLDDNDFCSRAACDRTSETYKKAEEIIMSWAAEHPEPVYPTWIEWLKTLGVIPYLTGYVSKRDEDGNYLSGHVDVNEIASKPISAYFAEKHNILPKEET